MEEFEDIRITGLIPDKTELRREGGSLSTGKIKLFFGLSSKPPTAWTVEFEQRWLKGGSVEKAVFADDGVYIRWNLSDGMTCGEMLKAAVGSTNNWYRAALKEMEIGEQTEADHEAALRQQVEDLAKKLKFD